MVWEEWDLDNEATVTAEDGLLHIAFGEVSGSPRAGAMTVNTVGTDALVVAKLRGERGSSDWNVPWQLRLLCPDDLNSLRNKYRHTGDITDEKRYFRNFRNDSVHHYKQYSSDTYPSLEWRIVYLKKLHNWQAAGAFTDYYNGNRIGIENQDSYSINNAFYIRIQAGTFNSWLDSYCDWVFVAQYDSINPIWESFGEQELIYNLEIGDITGGLFRVKAVIRNIGYADITDVDWDITFEGGLIILGGYTPGIISIPVGGEETVKSNVVLGFGQTVISVNAQLSPYVSDSKDQAAQVFFVFIIL
jgi:hypothetical protein